MDSLRATVLRTDAIWFLDWDDRQVRLIEYKNIWQKKYPN
jgi:hypothetical protein